MNNEHGTESDVSDAIADAPDAGKVPDIEGTLNPTADDDIAGVEGEQPGFTFPGPGA